MTCSQLPWLALALAQERSDSEIASSRLARERRVGRSVLVRSTRARVAGSSQIGARIAAEPALELARSR